MSDEEIRTRALVARYSTGNLNLRRGRYITYEEHQARLKAVLDYKFA